jgi:hypothetical protein
MYLKKIPLNTSLNITFIIDYIINIILITTFMKTSVNSPSHVRKQSISRSKTVHSRSENSPRYGLSFSNVCFL